MRCPHCSSTTTAERSDRTAHGYRRLRCRGCGRQFNERTGSLLNRLQVPTDMAFLVVLWRLRMKLSLRDLAEVLLLRGLVFSHDEVRDVLRPATKRKQHVPPARRRAVHVQRVAALRDMLAIA